MALRSDITPALCAQFLRYDEQSGLLFWRHRGRKLFRTDRAFHTFNTRFAGYEAGGVTNGYRTVTILGVIMLAHRVIVAIKTGAWPEFVDHEDGDGLNNRWSNLRDTDHQTNMKNRSLRKDNASGHVGVKWLSARKRWEAFIIIDGKRKRIGRYKLIEDAAAARTQASLTNGFHANHGRRKIKTAQRPKPLRRFIEDDRVTLR